VKALAVEAPGAARVVTRPEPTPAAGEALLRVAYAGLCGTDLATFVGRNPLVSYPRVIGHEISGTVVDVAPNVDRSWLRRRVAVNPYKHCGACSACQIGRPNACRRNETLGVQREGALAELVAVPVERLVPSDRLPLDVLALVEPFSIGMHVVVRTGVAAADTVLVIGCGGVGIGAVAAAASRGASSRSTWTRASARWQASSAPTPPSMQRPMTRAIGYARSPAAKARRWPSKPRDCRRRTGSPSTSWRRGAASAVSGG
jgi:threonine dehydrogenase-like Zn-dependent dehydrogenase